MTALLKRVRQFIRERDLAGRQTRVLVALSGGSDSVALAHIIRELDAAGEKSEGARGQADCKAQKHRDHRDVAHEQRRHEARCRKGHRAEHDAEHDPLLEVELDAREVSDAKTRDGARGQKDCGG